MASGASVTGGSIDADADDDARHRLAWARRLLEAAAQVAQHGPDALATVRVDDDDPAVAAAAQAALELVRDEGGDDRLASAPILEAPSWDVLARATESLERAREAVASAHDAAERAGEALEAIATADDQDTAAAVTAAAAAQRDVVDALEAVDEALADVDEALDVDDRTVADGSTGTAVA